MMADHPQLNAKLPGQDLFVEAVGEDPFFVSVEPREVAFFARVPTSKLIDFAEQATNGGPRRSVIEDHYYDTRDGAMASAGCSVRLRRYVEPPSDLSFEVIWLAWDTPGEPESRGPAPTVRANQVVVQSFRASSDSDYREHAETLAHRGLSEILCVRKARHKFEMEPLSIHEVMPGDYQSFSRIAHLDASFRRVPCMGLRVLVDQLEHSLMGFTSIVEIEFGEEYEPRGRELVDHLTTHFGSALTEKSRNKICYFLTQD